MMTVSFGWVARGDICPMQFGSINPMGGVEGLK